MIYNLELKMNSVIILAGGSGIRMDENIPKQFIKINNKMILEYSLEEFIKNKNIDEIIIVCHKNWHTIASGKDALDELIDWLNDSSSDAPHPDTLITDLMGDDYKFTINVTDSSCSQWPIEWYV